MSQTPIRILCSRNTPTRACDPSPFGREAGAAVRRVHRQAPGYTVTPLVPLTGLARQGGVKAVLVKDESTRFGLKAFKGLGGLYAMFRILCAELGLDPAATTLEQLRQEPYRSRVARMTFITTTDGNHGKGVSWAAGVFGCRAYVYMPKGTVEVRAQAIRDAGNAEVTITDMRYDDCVAYTRGLAERNGWHLIQDTAWPGFEQVPLWIMQGYITLYEETEQQLQALGYAQPTHIFLQAGVGSMAGAVAAAAVCRCEKPPVIATVEPETVACFYESFLAGDGQPHMATGSCETIMAGLNCAIPCPTAWAQLRSAASFAFAVDDAATRSGMRLLARNDPPVISGESGAVTAGLTQALLTDPACAELRAELGLDADSVILLISTEGDTDPDDYRAVVGASAETIAAKVP